MQELGLVKGKMRSVLPLVSILLFSLTVSCALIPKKVGTRGKITKRTLEFLEEGVTSREQVLLHLGEPDFVGENEQIFVWEWVGAWDLLLVGGYTAAVIPFRKCNGLLIKFNDQASVQAVERWGEEIAYDEACKLGGPLSRSNKYTNHVYGFSIQFPPAYQAWRVIGGDQSFGELDASDFPRDWGVRDGALIIAARKFDLGGFAWLSIAAYPIAEELDVWEVRPERIANILGPTALKASRIVDLVGSETTTVSLVGSGRTRTMDGSHAIWMKQEIEKQDSGLAIVSLTYSLVHHRKLFQISGYWPKNNDESQAQKFEQKIEKAIWSFRFIR